MVHPNAQKVVFIFRILLFHVLTWRSFAKHNTINITTSQCARWLIPFIWSLISFETSKVAMYNSNWFTILVLLPTFVCSKGMW